MIEFLGNLFSNALAVTILVILVTSLIGFYVRMRGRDRCLRDLAVPRTSALVRHAGKQEKLTWEEWLGLDDLPSLPWLKRLVRVRKDQPLRLMVGAVGWERTPPRTGKERD